MIQPRIPIQNRSLYTSGVDGSESGSETGDNDSGYQNWLLRRQNARNLIQRLSRRELQVVAMVATGYANKSIAQELDISVKTIEKHRANASRKLGVTNTACLVRLSVLADLEPTPMNLPAEWRELSLRSAIGPDADDAI